VERALTISIYTWPFGLPSLARHEHELARARSTQARCDMMHFVLMPCRHYVPRSRHSTNTRPFFRVVPARGTATGTMGRLYRASTWPDTTIAPHSGANFTRTIDITYPKSKTDELQSYQTEKKSQTYKVQKIK
jgi:hypothetical protein